ncbi:5-oxoprolinase subunit PxpB [Nocardioides pocheonensis]|uniref:5-oxoprolinase subunit PxpB n=1 Tax=Nocardioides pocheonensis TaxID=661485 RepID=A0A3N0GUA5_9ACTN|nr:5-oxoprolinase subunit PxpB [Nocardioides pocheonensis]RNM16045.1 5-oxoprolinase subunit PxpB [Nocardioides pocheonensis]
MQVRRVGERALLVECADLGEVTATYAVLRDRQAELAVTDLVPAARTVLLDGVVDVESVAALLEGLPPQAGDLDPGPRRMVEIPVTYDGPDLAEVARQWSVEEAEVVRIHTTTEFVVAFCGFAPGFAYCTGLPDALAVRRRAEPRSRVPAGSVALAGEFASVYPSASPGGWQLIGSTAIPVWRPEAEPPALLEPGTTVRFRDAGT